MRLRPKGFTLVELLVVIGIITLLIAVLLPALNKARDSAIAIQCQSNLRQQGVVLNMYTSENRGIIPHTGMFPIAGEGWWVVLSRYTGRLDASNNLISGQGMSDGKGRAAAGIWTCPIIGRVNGPGNEARNAQFGANLNFFLRWYTDASNNKVPSPQFRTNKIHNASGKVSFMEYNMYNQDTRGIGLNVPVANVDNVVTRTIANDRDLWMNSVYGTNAEIRFRHNGRANLLFFDGHVEARPIGSLTYRPFMISPESR